MKYANTSGVLRWSGGTTVLKRGDSFDDDHPLVSERADLFTDEEPGANHKAPSRVQSTMQRPGEARTERGAPAAPVKQAPPRKTNPGA